MEKNNAIAIRYNDDFAVVQANELIRSKQDSLTLLEAKLIRIAIAQVVKEDTDLKTYTCKVTELADYLGISRSNVYRDIQKLSKSLMKKSIFIKDTSQPNKRGKENYKIIHWIDYIEYSDGTLTFKLSENLKPYLIGLDKFFSSYGMYTLRETPSYTALRVYELLISYSNMCIQPGANPNYTNIPIADDEIIFTLDWLREVLNFEEIYPKNREFLLRVIEPSVKIIRQQTFMSPTYRLVKEGRSIKYIVFKLYGAVPNVINQEKIRKILEKASCEQSVKDYQVEEIEY